MEPMLAFRGLENSRSFGTPTTGYASANMVLPPPGGASYSPMRVSRSLRSFSKTASRMSA